MHKAPRQNPSEPVSEGDARLDSAAFHRNHAPIWEVLSPWLRDKTGHVLEVGSGTGQHIVEFARRSPHLRWWPSDFEPRNLESIDAWRDLARVQNLESPRRVDVTAPDWGLGTEDSATLTDLTAVFCANVLHISPWATTEGLMRGSGQRLHPGGRLFVYGPFKQDGKHTAPTNEAFDASLRARDPQWGVRDLNDIRDEALGHDLVLAEIAPMPANNMILIFECRRVDLKRPAAFGVDRA
jgi:SAM-dependent methyltransferase